MSDPVRVGKSEAAAAIWQWRDREIADRSRIGKLRRSGIVRAAIAGAASVALFFFERPIAAGIAIGIASITLVLAVFSPGRGYVALTRGVERLGRLVGTVMTWILLTPVFLLFFAPFGLLARRGTRDRLHRRWERSRPSYWKARTTQHSLERPY